MSDHKDEIEKMRAENLRLRDALDAMTMERNRLRRIIETQARALEVPAPQQ